MARSVVLLLAVALIGCQVATSPSADVEIPTVEQIGVSTAAEIIEIDDPGTPVNIDSLKAQPWLETTSGVLSKREALLLCPKDTSRHFGRYFLIDRFDGKGPFGELTVHYSSESGNWLYLPNNDEFVGIVLRTDRISLWGELSVGDRESKILDFIGKRFHYKKGTVLVTDIGEFQCAFTILGDTVHELSVMRNCEVPSAR